MEQARSIDAYQESNDEQINIIDKLPSLPYVFRQLKVGEHNIKPIVFLDLETTGLLAGVNEVIELALVRCSCNVQTGEILSIDDFYTALREPEHDAISTLIESITGLNYASVKGHSISHSRVQQILQGAYLVVSHNANFDRPFFDDLFVETRNLLWACSIECIPWKTVFKKERVQLTYLAKSTNVKYAAHRALNDTIALIEVVRRTSGAFLYLLDNVNNGYCRLSVEVNPEHDNAFLQQQLRFFYCTDTFKFVRTICSSSVGDLLPSFFKIVSEHKLQLKVEKVDAKDAFKFV